MSVDIPLIFFLGCSGLVVVIIVVGLWLLVDQRKKNDPTPHMKRKPTRLDWSIWGALFLMVGTTLLAVITRAQWLLWVTVLIIVLLSVLRFIRLIKKGAEYGKKPVSDEYDSTGTKGTP